MQSTEGLHCTWCAAPAKGSPERGTKNLCTAASAYEQRDSVRRRRLLTTVAPKPPPYPRKLQQSGKRSAHRLPGHGCTHKSAWYPVQCAASMTDAAQASSWQGSCERGGLGAPFAFNQKSICKVNAWGRTLAAGPPPRLSRRLSSPILSSR